MNTIYIDVVGEWGVGKTAYISKLRGIDVFVYNPSHSNISIPIIIPTTIGNIEFVLTEHVGHKPYDIFHESDALFVFVDNTDSIKSMERYIRTGRENVIICLNKYDSPKREILYDHTLLTGMTTVRTSIYEPYSIYEPINAVLRSKYGNDCHVILQSNPVDTYYSV